MGASFGPVHRNTGPRLAPFFFLGASWAAAQVEGHARAGPAKAYTYSQLEPKHYQIANGRWGVHPDQSRNRLIFTGHGEKGVGIPLGEWGLEFMENMPQSILAAISEARGELGGSLEDDSYRKRLQDKFGDRWKTRILVRAQHNDTDRQPAAQVDDNVEVFEHSALSSSPAIDRMHKRTITVVKKKAVRAGSNDGAEREVPVDH